MKLSAHRSNAFHKDAPEAVKNKQGTRIEVEFRPDEVAVILERGALSQNQIDAIFSILKAHHSNGRQRIHA